MSSNRGQFQRTRQAGHIFRLFAVFSLILAAGVGHAQELLQGLNSGGNIRLQQTDFAVLELQEPRHDLQCEVSPAKPELDLDFKFHTGYRVEVPLRDLAGTGNALTILFRVVPLDREADPVYMIQKIRVPGLEEDTKGAGEFVGEFTLGEGRYHVDWLMRDRAERVCAAFWNLETRLSAKDSRMRAWIPPGPARPLQPLFAEASLVPSEPKPELLHVGIIVNFVPQDSSSAVIDERELDDLVAILRRIGTDPAFGTYSVVACSLETQQVVYRQSDASRIDIPALGQALGSLKFGTVNAKQLASKTGLAEFAASLVNEQINGHALDTLIVLGSKAGWENGMSSEVLESIKNFEGPAFYLSYQTKAQASPWRDPFSSIMKRLRGIEYSIRSPKDLFNAWTDVVSRAKQAMHGPQSLASEGGTGR